MKKSLLVTLLGLSLIASQALAISPAEMAEAKAMANQALNPTQNSGESIFTNKHSTQTDFTSSSVKIDPFASNETQAQNPANYGDFPQASM